MILSQSGEVSILQQNSIHNVVLMGICGSGKSEIGRHLARRLGFGFCDLDQWIEKTAQHDIAQIFAEQGEGYFRQLESQALRSLVNIKNHVIALGGGATQDEENWRLILSLGLGVWLDTPPHIIARRLAPEIRQLKKRPLLADLVKEPDSAKRVALTTALLEQLRQQRLARLAEAALIYQDCYAAVDEVALQLKRLLEAQALAKMTKRKKPRGQDKEGQQLA